MLARCHDSVRLRGYGSHMKQELPLRYEELMRVRVPSVLIEAIDRAAHRDLVSRSGYIRQAVIARLRADGVGIEETVAA